VGSPLGALLTAPIAVIIAPTLTGFLVVTYGYPSMFTAAVVATLIGHGRYDVCKARELDY
jgi:dipeptide/tripeptide permease